MSTQSPARAGKVRKPEAAQSFVKRTVFAGRFGRNLSASISTRAHRLETLGGRDTLARAFRRMTEPASYIDESAAIFHFFLPAFGNRAQSVESPRDPANNAGDAIRITVGVDG